MVGEVTDKHRPPRDRTQKYADSSDKPAKPTKHGSKLVERAEKTREDKWH